jgi:hypothetical protein
MCLPKRRIPCLDHDTDPLSDAGSSLAAADLCRAELRSVSEIPALQDFLAFGGKNSMFYSVIVAHSRLIKPAAFRAIDGLFENAWPKACDPLPSALYARGRSENRR